MEPEGSLPHSQEPARFTRNTKFTTYASFYISVTKEKFPLMSDTGVWADGRPVPPYRGRVTPDYV
jgi:hypothetical protein